MSLKAPMSFEKAHSEGVHEDAFRRMVEACRSNHHGKTPTRGHETALRLALSCEGCQEELKKDFPKEDVICAIVRGLLWVGDYRSLELETTGQMARHWKQCSRCGVGSLEKATD